MRRQRAKIVRHQCVMPECNHIASKLSIVVNLCDRNCPKCDDGDNIKTMIPTVLAREIKPHTNLFHFNHRDSHLIPEVSESFDWITCSDNLVDLLRQSRD